MNTLELRKQLYYLTFYKNFNRSQVKTPNCIETNAKIITLLRENAPKTLYRYRSCSDNNIDSFRTGSIYAGKASKFNDPYDSVLFCELSQLVENIRDSYIRHGGEMTPEWIDNFEQLKPQFEILLEKWRDSVKIACFSESQKNMLMWSHYADYHKGFVVEYDIEHWDALKFNCDIGQRQREGLPIYNLQPVFYETRRTDATQWAGYLLINYLGIPNDGIPDINIAEKTYLVKSDDWQYENEWRIIFQDSHENDSITIQKDPIAIYYGSQISDPHKLQLREIAREKGLREYQMRLSHENPYFELDFDEI